MCEYFVTQFEGGSDVWLATTGEMWMFELFPAIKDVVRANPVCKMSVKVKHVTNSSQCRICRALF